MIKWHWQKREFWCVVWGGLWGLHFLLQHDTTPDTVILWEMSLFWSANETLSLFCLFTLWPRIFPALYTPVQTVRNLLRAALVVFGTTAILYWFLKLIFFAPWLAPLFTEQQAFLFALGLSVVCGSAKPPIREKAERLEKEFRGGGTP